MRDTVLEMGVRGRDNGFMEEPSSFVEKRLDVYKRQLLYRLEYFRKVTVPLLTYGRMSLTNDCLLYTSRCV